MTMLHKLTGAAGFLLLSAGVALAAPATAVTDLNVRAGQGTGYRVIGTIPAGATVNVSGCGDGWCYVSNFGGYASARYLDRGFNAFGYSPGVTFGYQPYRRPYGHWRRWHRHW